VPRIALTATADMDTRKEIIERWGLMLPEYLFLALIDRILGIKLLIKPIVDHSF